MDILITGVNGFLGINIAKMLAKSGHRVVGLGKKKISKLEFLHAYHSISVLDQQSLNLIVKEIDCVIHLAAITAHAEIIDNKYETLDINLNGTRNILNAFKSSIRAKKFIYASSGKVYGNMKELPLTEESDTSPINILGKSKLIAEKLIDFYSDKDKSYLIFRIFQAYGPGQIKSFLIPTIISQINFKTNLPQTIVLGDINAKRDYIFIEDIAYAFLSAINKNHKKGLEIYNLSSSIPLSAKEIISIIEKNFKLKINIKVNKKLFRSDEESVEYGTYEKAKKDLNWSPTFSFEKGIFETIKSKVD